MLAAAGSRKTTSVVNMALADTSSRILILTYTIENLATIESYFVGIHGMVPPNVTLQSWYSFLLQDGARPYQSTLYSGPRIENIAFIQRTIMPYPARSNPSRYYLAGSTHIYKDFLAEFVHFVNQQGSGCVMNRLSQIYDRIFIDEVQDMAGYDWQLIEALMRTPMQICCVGDPRQGTFSTANTNKNKRYKGSGCYDKFKEWEKKGLCAIQEMTDCYRSNQMICDHADLIFPHYPRTKSRFTDISGHDGVFKIPAHEVNTYHQAFSPVVLRYNVKSDTLKLPGLNIGITKGKTFERVLIFPTQPIIKYLTSGNISGLADKSRAGLYVAVTRARYSVAFAIPDKKAYANIPLPEYLP